jgi:hypothetical protein
MRQPGEILPLAFFCEVAISQICPLNFGKCSHLGQKPKVMSA